MAQSNMNSGIETHNASMLTYKLHLVWEYYTLLNLSMYSYSKQYRLEIFICQNFINVIIRLLILNQLKQSISIGTVDGETYYSLQKIPNPKWT